MHTGYIIPSLRQFRDEQIRFASREEKIKQLDRIEAILGDLNVDQVYSLEDLCFKITGHESKLYAQLELPGDNVAHDLRLLLEDLSNAAEIPADAAGERVWTVDDLAKEFRVSTKTISRWRRQGLVSRVFVFDDRKRVGILQSSLNRFVERNSDQVQRAAGFQQMSEKEKQRIIVMARHVIETEKVNISEVIKRVSSETGRSVETIRYTLKQYGRENPDASAFSGKGGPLREQAKKTIYEQYTQGETVASLATKFNRTKTSIYRVISEMRVQRIMELPLKFVSDDSIVHIRTARQEAELLGPPPTEGATSREPQLPVGLPQCLSDACELPLLNQRQEMHLFRKMNYLKYRASKIRQMVDPARPKSSLVNRIETLYSQSVEVKNQIVSANQRLILPIIERHAEPTEDFMELFNASYATLMRAVETFDFTSGDKFSTYATATVKRDLLKTRRNEQTLPKLVDPDVLCEEPQSRSLDSQKATGQFLSTLTEREKRILGMRFGLASEQRRMTLKEIGIVLGITKERVRQIEARALQKLRSAFGQSELKPELLLKDCVGE